MKSIGKVMRLSLFCGALMTSLNAWSEVYCTDDIGNKYWESRLRAPASEFANLHKERDVIKEKINDESLSEEDRKEARRAFLNSADVVEKAYQRYLAALKRSGGNVDITTGNDVSKDLKIVFGSSSVGYISGSNTMALPTYEGAASTGMSDSEPLRKNEGYYIDIVPHPDPKFQAVKLRFSDDAIKQCEQQLQCKSEEIGADAKGNACVVFVDEWRKAADSVKNADRNYRITNLKKGLIAGEREWERFFKESRYQYLWEKWLTAKAYSKKLKGDKFAPPPQYQIHLLRPWVVMEYVGNAVDGSQFKGAISLEVIGINYWNGGYRSFDWIDFPFGVSAVVTFSDREGVDDVAYGAMFHAMNSYSFGVTARGSGEVGVFLTADLLKVFSDKQSELEYWDDKKKEYAP